MSLIADRNIPRPLFQGNILTPIVSCENLVPGSGALDSLDLRQAVIVVYSPIYHSGGNMPSPIRSFALASAILLTWLGASSSLEAQVTLRIAANAGPEGEAVRQLAASYKDAKVEVIELPYETLRQQLISQLNRTRSGFDVLMVDDPWFVQVAPRLLNLSRVPSDLLADVVPASLNLGRQHYGKGPLSGLPFVGDTEILLARSDVLHAMGVRQIPQDWQDLADLAVRITQTSQVKLGHKVYGYSIRGRAGAPIVTDFLPIYWSLGGKLLDSNEYPRSVALNRAIFERALAIYGGFASASPPGAQNYDWPDMTEAFASGRAAIELNWPQRFLSY